MTRRENDFTKFYYTKVGLGEGCGCAEKVIDVHEFNRLAGTSKRRRRWISFPNRKALRRALAKAGLTRRPKAPREE